MRFLVTRVQPQADAWVRQLCAAGHEAQALPLIEVHALADVSAVQAAGQRWSSYHAVMFVSHHAVNCFFKENQALALYIQAQATIKTRVWTTGPGTTKALLAQGVPASLLDAPDAQSGQFDSEALWQRVQSQVQPGQRVLIVRGRSQPLAGLEETLTDAGVGRDWLAQRLTQAGAQVDFVVSYQRGAPDWGSEQRTVAQMAAVDGTVWLFSSAEAIGYLNELLPQQDWSQALAVATHPRIAQAARSLGFGQVQQARPVVADVLASIESFR
ncbi:uroporphyrinogen-III synthase [Rhodoferax sp.]|uniref:uroporphyrinogen-III synthase n=1 Tax=Rhodoferax sp. TaxID=50421 RepID=UPI002624FE42|nr:uroporphyrinogen-III synthase [Rhodoferax sp.]MDD2808843.1 uroporphyrinogen-III synthase [Rhodoferax sp.]MDD4942444.1 uroporphyrinogen-III synthase [Rhodoferax sp.]